MQELGFAIGLHHDLILNPVTFVIIVTMNRQDVRCIKTDSIKILKKFLMD